MVIKDSEPVATGLLIKRLNIIIDYNWNRGDCLSLQTQVHFNQFDWLNLASNPNAREYAAKTILKL
jgi:hypothetical protein